jgi:hypothetical protein
LVLEENKGEFGKEARRGVRSQNPGARRASAGQMPRLEEPLWVLFEDFAIFFRREEG